MAIASLRDPGTGPAPLWGGREGLRLKTLFSGETPWTLRTNSAALRPEGPSSLQTRAEGRSPRLCHGAELHGGGAHLPARLPGKQGFRGNPTAEADELPSGDQLEDVG